MSQIIINRPILTQEELAKQLKLLELAFGELLNDMAMTGHNPTNNQSRKFD